MFDLGYQFTEFLFIFSSIYRNVKAKVLMIIASSSQNSKDKNVTAYSLQKLLQIKDKNHKKLCVKKTV